MFRYWHDHAAFVIAKNYDVLPPGDSNVYAFPDDLLVPDFAFFLNGALNPKVYNTPEPVSYTHLLLLAAIEFGT